MVVGTSCSGKTTLSKNLSRIFDIPHIQLDLLFWEKNWQSVPPEIFIDRVQNEISKNNWIIDGNFHSTFDIVKERANHIIWLNYPLPLVFYRGLKRTLSRISSQEEILNGNRETFRMSFLSRDSILLWILTSHNKLKKRYEPIFTSAENQNIDCIRLKSQSETDNFLSNVQNLL